MKRSRILALAGGLVAATIPWLAASCATTEKGGDAPPPSEQLPEASTVDVQDAGSADATVCDAADPNCVTQNVSCETVAWCPVPTPVTAFYALTAVWGTAANNVWAVGSGGTIVHWDGTTWTASPTGVKNTFRVIGGTGPNDIWVASATDTIFRGNGTSWVKQTPPTNQFNTVPVYGLWTGPGGGVRLGTRAYDYEVPVPPDGFAYFTGNQFSKVDVDGGFSWENHEGFATVYGFYGTADDLWLIADNSTYEKWQLGMTMHGKKGAGGKLEWVEVDSQSAVALNAIWGSSVDDVWAVGDRGTLRRIRAGQTTWEIVESPTLEPLNAVWGSAADDVWAVGQNGTILHFDGATWKTDQAAFPVGKTKADLYGVWGSGKNDVWIVGDGIALHYTGPKGASK